MVLKYMRDLSVCAETFGRGGVNFGAAFRIKTDLGDEIAFDFAVLWHTVTCCNDRAITSCYGLVSHGMMLGAEELSALAGQTPPSTAINASVYGDHAEICGACGDIDGD
eukprot:2516020-Rhodomonas_salina.3